MLVDRKTEIIGCGVPVNKKKKILPLSDMEVLRKRIRTIMDEQDRIQEDMFLRWNSLNHRVEDLEDEVEALKSMETTKDQEVPG
jgi:chaperonin cofactor prefoldin